MEMDSRTVAFLAVAAFMSLLLLCCIVLSVLFYIRYRDTEYHKDDNDRTERQRIKKLKEKLMKQFKHDLKKQNSKREGKVAPVIFADDTETACSICLDSLAVGDVSDTVLALLIKCGHIYHMDCVWPWLERDHSCPICRCTVDLCMADLKAVTVYHVIDNIDIPSIRESVSRVDLRSRLNFDCCEVVSVCEDDLKTPRSSRVISVIPAEGTSDSVMMPGGSGCAGDPTNTANPAVNNDSVGNNDSSIANSSMMSNEITIHTGDNTGTPPSVHIAKAGTIGGAPAIFTVGGMDGNQHSDV